MSFNMKALAPQNKRTHTLSINALASSILAGRVESDDEVVVYVGEEEQKD